MKDLLLVLLIMLRNVLVTLLEVGLGLGGFLPEKLHREACRLRGNDRGVEKWRALEEIRDYLNAAAGKKTYSIQHNSKLLTQKLSSHLKKPLEQCNKADFQAAGQQYRELKATLSKVALEDTKQQREKTTIEEKSTIRQRKPKITSQYSNSNKPNKKQHTTTTTLSPHLKDA